MHERSPQAFNAGCIALRFVFGHGRLVDLLEIRRKISEHVRMSPDDLGSAYAPCFVGEGIESGQDGCDSLELSFANLAQVLAKA